MTKENIPLTIDKVDEATVEGIPIDKPDGMSKEAASTYDLMSKAPKVKRPASIQKRINKLENKINANLNKVMKSKKRNARSKQSRKKNRKK